MEKSKTKQQDGCDRFCKGYVTRQKKLVQRFRNSLAKRMTGKNKKTFIDAVSKANANQDAAFRTACEKAYCNESCKDTVFQDGKEVPAAVFKSFKGSAKDKEMFKSILRATRKRIFGNKKSVLKDSFYTGLAAKDVKRLKSEGASSGCTLIAL
jgi:hypothetical protein